VYYNLPMGQTLYTGAWFGPVHHEHKKCTYVLAIHPFAACAAVLATMFSINTTPGSCRSCCTAHSNVTHVAAEQMVSQHGSSV
jgi:hypothetical protein